MASNPKTTDTLHVSDIARICHEANRALQVIQLQSTPGIGVSAPWDKVTDEIQDSAIDGVLNAMEGASPEESHENWIDFKLAQGYTWGPVKDEVAKTHPLLVPWSELEARDRFKDELFGAIVAVCVRHGVR